MDESTLWVEAEKLHKQKRFKEAEEKYSKYIQICLSTKDSLEQTKCDLALAYNNRGQTKYKQVLFDEAVQDYQTAISYDPKCSIFYYNKGTIHYRLGNFKDAHDDLQRASLLQPNFTEARIALDKINEQLKQSACT